MTKTEKIQLVKQLLAESRNCGSDVFDSGENIFIESEKNFFLINSFGKNAVVWADKQIIGWLSETFKSTSAEMILDSDNFYIINEKLRSFGKKLSEEYSCYLHLFPEKAVARPAGFTYKFFDQDTIQELVSYVDTFQMALSVDDDKKIREVMAVAAYHEDTLVALSACDKRPDNILNIGIDTTPEYRGRGLATYLVKELTLEIEKRGYLAGYTTWHGNIASTRTALSAGFYPVWVNYFNRNL